MARNAVQGQTTYKAFHKAWPIDSKRGRQPCRGKEALPQVDLASFLNDTHTTTTQVHHKEFPVSRRPGPSLAQAKPHLPWLADTTTNKDVYRVHSLPMLTLPQTFSPVFQVPFDAYTEYQTEFLSKEPRPFLAHLTGT
jgi:hypothetical protein